MMTVAIFLHVCICDAQVVAVCRSKQMLLERMYSSWKDVQVLWAPLQPRSSAVAWRQSWHRER